MSAVEFRLGLIITVGVLGVAGFAAARLRGRARTLALGMIAGLGYGVVGVAARILVGFTPSDLVHDSASYALAAAGVLSFMFYTAALEHGDVTTATAATVITETVLPATIGVLFLGDTTRHGLVGVAAAGFALAVAGALTLARFGETEAPADPGRSVKGPPRCAGRPERTLIPRPERLRAGSRPDTLAPVWCRCGAA